MRRSYSGTKRHARAAFLALLIALPGSGCQRGSGAPAAERIGVRFADAIIARWPDPLQIDPTRKRWEYNTGIVLFGMSKIHERTRDRRYLDYIRRWVDAYVKEDGTLQWDQDRTHNLDFIQPAMLLLILHEQTGARKYADAAKQVRGSYDRIPRNAEGGFWHKSIYPNEMWVDGIYMASPFLVRYGALFGDSAFCYDTVVFQTMLAAKHAHDKRTRLMFHAWDQDRNAAWAHPETGLSPVFWSRGMGWYVMALVDILERLPGSHPGYGRLHELLRNTAEGIRLVQDPRTGLWFQVLDQGDRPDNWIESSGSGMMIYALRKAVRLKLIDEKYSATAEMAWKGLRAFILTDEKGLPVITGAVRGMGVQKDYESYVRMERLQNSSHGLMAVQIAASQMEW